MGIEAIEKGLYKSDLETATFGMGCFWGPEARFGSLPGVIRTRVGYTGGTTPSPTYRQMGDHTETVEIDFDPKILRYEDVLRHFWRNHYPNRDQYKGRQYLSLLRCHDDKQLELAEIVKREMEEELGESIETDIAELTGFTLAEERHQKYYLKRYPKALEQLGGLYRGADELLDSTFAARLNGFVKGFRSKDSLLEEIADWEIDVEAKRVLSDLFRQMKW
ncbi:peptide-methionine (S)-S-oxide reductase MsrA [Sporosarcina thermotolerans]|uniref:Peptide methionine sulfoxide reductase MsrA n=1 Tax=Sporosarcina thermotolerans TaxID=633404 RepID=A0AAW9A6Z8_9BACL|nr:peptide-methionine (S)-S-oxide reductase MsrA [Sporosarcina thermotolerans]MDW0116085.1 peptide-methionine (S)-S-oxide reductase MsrA [Sporosarcina thermotolerans]